MALPREASSEAGFTLTELMVVVAIVAVLSLVMGVAMSRQGHAGAVSKWANAILLTLRSAQATAQDTGAVAWVEFNSSGTVMTLRRNTALGAGAVVEPGVALAERRASSGAMLQTIAGSAQVAAVSSPGSGALDTKVVFSPDGSATAVTIYVRDIANLYHEKVVVFGMTGHSRLITRW